jgi:dihydrofolate reductase
MRKIIAALQTSLDGFIEGPNGELDWAMENDDETWDGVFEMLGSVDACILGRVMYPGYEQYWLNILANPAAGSKSEIDYARWADKTVHFVVSKTLTEAKWKTSRIVRDLEEIRDLKQQPGKNMYAVGGATLVSSLMNAGLIDEVQVLVNPVILGRGKALFKDVEERHGLNLTQVKPLKSGKVKLNYHTQS